MPEQRLQKLLARAGVASRRAAEQLIVAGRVKVDGHVVRTLGAKANESARVEVDGLGEVQAEPRHYLMLHKPPHVIASVHDPEGRPTVLDVVAESDHAGAMLLGKQKRLFPVGRLDFDSEGLILLTNDGPMVHGLLHPSRHVPKVYTIKVRGQPGPATLARLTQPMRIYDEDGRLLYRCQAASVEVVRLTEANCWLELTLLEGRSHQVKRMCAAIGHPCTRLVRTAFAGLELGSLPTGAWRPLTQGEVAKLTSWLRAGASQACKKAAPSVKCASRAAQAPQRAPRKRPKTAQRRTTA